MIADYFVREDRRSVVGLPETDADGWIEQVLALHDLGSGSPRIWVEEVVAVSGERLVLYWIGLEYPNSSTNRLLASSPFDVDVDLVDRFITFDPEDLDAAVDELECLSTTLEAEDS